MKTKEEILEKKFKERGIRKCWIDESKQSVLDAMDEYADEKVHLYNVKSFLLDKPSTCGWHFDSDFLRIVTKKANKHNPLITMEQVECVLRTLSEQ